MRFVFRSDASLRTGVGHVMRSSAIAEEAIDRGISCVFIGEITEIPWLSIRVRNLGFHEVIGTDKGFVPSSKSDVLILDSYSVHPQYEFIDLKNWLAVINIFDNATPNYNSNLRIHPGIEKISDFQFHHKTLSGPEYTPIRKSLFKRKSTLEKGKLRISVIGGGTDVHGFVSAIAEVLKELDIDFLARLVTTFPIDLEQDTRFEIIKPGLDIDSIFYDTDLAFTTASTTSLEFLFSGCAVGIACAIENQQGNYSLLAKSGIARPIGVYVNGTWDLKSDAILALVSDISLRNELRQYATNFIDSDGAKRIVDSILDLAHEIEEKGRI